MVNKHEEILKKAIKKHEKQEAAKEKKIQTEEDRYRRKVNDFKKNETELYPEKMVIAEKIMKWVKSFNKEFNFKEVVIFYGSWGHKLPRYGGGGCWSRIYFQSPNKLKYWAGYKWMPTGPTIIFEDAKHLSEKLSYDYLNSLHQAIKTGKVYKNVAKEIEEYEKLE